MTTETSPRMIVREGTPIERARALRPVIEPLCDEMEAQRRMPRALVQAMADARLWHLLVPKSLGGEEIDPVTFVRVLEEVSAIDGSAGWNLMIGGSAGIFSGFLEEHMAKEIYGSPDAVLAGALAPTGRAIAEDGGYRVTGKWSFGSGIHHATYVGGNCIVYDGETPREMMPGVPFMRLMLAPVSDVQIHDTWHVSGLRGTGSEDYSFNEVFVPEERAILPFFGDRHQDGPLYRTPMAFFSTIVAAVGLGIARAAVDALVELATTKVPQRFGAPLPLRERARAQTAVAQAEALVGSARAYLYEALNDMWETAQAGDEVSLEQRAKLRGAAAHAATASAQAVDLAYLTGGGSSIYERSLLQRCFRDAHAVTQHVTVAPDSLEDVGRTLFGLQPKMIIF